MPIIDRSSARAVAPGLYTAPGTAWRALQRIEDSGGDVNVVIDALTQFGFDRLVYAEGDSWFDKFTPIPLAGTNLLEALRTPFFTGVVDVSHIGDESREMVSGRQARQTAAMFRLFDFDAILLSAGGNDLKNVFADLFAAKALDAAGVPTRWSKPQLLRADEPAQFSELYDEVIASIRQFVALRDASPRPRTRAAPLILHGYDYLQPRPAPAEFLVGSRIGRGPWIYPALKAAGLDDARMLAAARSVIDELNARLRAQIASLPNVHVIDARGLLTLAAPQTSGVSNDWLDEIHPTAAGFAKLTRNRWDASLARLLGWQPQPGDLLPPSDA